MVMEPRRSLCVLPSNAPAPGQSPEGSRGALKVGSGNLGLSSHEFAPAVSKSTSRVLNPTSLPTPHPQRYGYGTTSRIQDRRKRRHRSPDPIFTQAELHSDRYLAYLEKQRLKNKKSGEEQKWTDELEQAFQLALRKIPNLGRRKTLCVPHQCGRVGTRPCGRNEHIEHFIKWHTGITRCRKQVSSHIQVLKNFQKDNHAWMALVTKTGTNDRAAESGSRVLDRQVPDVHPTFLNQLPRRILDSSVPPQPHSIRRIKFEMYLLEPELLEKLHIYSSLQSEIGTASKALEEANGWRMTYPQLVPYYDRGELDGELVLFETSLDLMENHPPLKSQLGIDFTIDIVRGTEYTDWECHTKFYENNILTESLSTQTESEFLSGTGDARILVLLHSKWWVDLFVALTKENLQKEHKGAFLGIQHEAERLPCHIQDISVVQELRAKPRAGHSSPRRMAILLWNFRQTRNNEAATTTWRKLIPPAPLTEPYFNPSSSSQYLEPSLAIDTALHRDLLHPTPQYAEHLNHQPNLYVENPEILYAGQNSRFSSPLPPHEADYRSFPSSTSTSFPSSTSNSILPLELAHNSIYSPRDYASHSQDPSYDTQVLNYPSHDPMYSLQDYEYLSGEFPIPAQASTVHLHGSVVDVQHQEYLSKDSYYPLQDADYEPQHTEYTFPSTSSAPYQFTHNPNPTLTETDAHTDAAVQGLLEMHSQLSFSQPEDESSSYAAACVPLMGNIPPRQHQPDAQDDQHSPAPPYHDQRAPHPPDPFNLEQWHAMDQAVQWAHTQLQSGGFEEGGDMMDRDQVLGEIDEIANVVLGIDFDLGLIEAYGLGLDS